MTPKPYLQGSPIRLPFQYYKINGIGRFCKHLISVFPVDATAVLHNPVPISSYRPIRHSMKPTLLANTWMTAHLPGAKYMALMCAAGSVGEAAFHNSLDEAFAEVGHSHLSTTLNHRRPPTYQVVGTSWRRVIVGVRSSRTILAFPDATVLSNAATMCLRLTVATTVDMRQMLALEVLPDGLMDGCTSLTSIQLPPQVNSLGTRFLCGTSLTTINMSHMVSVKTLPISFLRDCACLTSLSLPPHIEEVGGNFLRGCAALTAIDMSMWLLVKTLPYGFMDGCASLTSLKFPPNVEELGYHALSGCASLTEIDMGHLVGVKSLPDSFMSYCTSLTSVVAPPNVERVGQRFLCGCANLCEMDANLLRLVERSPFNDVREWPQLVGLRSKKTSSSRCKIM